MIMKIPNEIKEAINDLAIYILEANKARHKIVTWLRNEMHISDIPFYNRVFPIFRFRFSTVNDITNTIYKCIEEAASDAQQSNIEYSFISDTLNNSTNDFEKG